jgi:excisionase family DNA binding protein
MPPELLRVDEVAEHLKLHVRTVRNFVRDGRLKAVRIGKQYRISREDVEAMMGTRLTHGARDTVGRSRRIEVTSVVQVEAIGPEEAMRLTNHLVAAANGRTDRAEPLHVQTMYDDKRGSLKVILAGGAVATARMLEFLSLPREI